MPRKARKRKEVAEETPSEEKKEVKVSKKFTCTQKKKMVGALVLLVLVAALSWYAGTMSAPAGQSDAGSDLVGNKVVDFLQSRLEASYPGIQVELANVEDYPNITDTYEVNVMITYQGQSQEVPYFASKDGKSLFTVIGDLDEQFESPTATTDTQQTGDFCSQFGITKSDKPKVEVFIMSYCPYGLQMQKAILPVMELLGDKADIEIKWVSYIMHGEKEIDENNAQECIKREYPDKYIDYASCFTVSGSNSDCMTEAGIDSTVIDSCIAELDAEFNISGLYADQSTWSGGRYPMYPVDAAENALYGVAGSPTTVINGKVVSLTRSPEFVKQAICCAFNTPPAECETELSTLSTSAGIGSGTGADTAAACG